jgi:hypothetical protein
VYSQRVDTSRDEAGWVGTTNAKNVREHSKSLTFAKAVRHLENRRGAVETVASLVGSAASGGASPQSLGIHLGIHRRGLLRSRADSCGIESLETRQQWTDVDRCGHSNAPFQGRGHGQDDVERLALRRSRIGPKSTRVPQ